jgi:hypothetical protein
MREQPPKESRQRLRASERSSGFLRDVPKRFRFLNAE